MGQVFVAFSELLNLVIYCYNDWIRNWKDFLILFFRAIWNGVNYFLFIFLFIIWCSSTTLSKSYKATKLTYVWCNLKKTIQLKMMHEQKKIQSLSQPVNFSNKKNTKKWWFHFFEIAKLLTKIISHLSLLLSTYVRKNKKKYVSIIAY